MNEEKDDKAKDPHKKPDGERDNKEPPKTPQIVPARSDDDATNSEGSKNLAQLGKLKSNTESSAKDDTHFIFRPLQSIATGPAPTDDESAAIAQDIVDFDLGLVVAGQRCVADVSPDGPRGNLRILERVAKDLSATAHWSGVAAPLAAEHWDAPLKQAIEAVADALAARHYLCGCLLELKPDQEPEFLGEKFQAQRKGLSTWLKSKHVTLILFVALPGRYTRRRFWNHCAEVRWLSHVAWCEDIGEKTELNPAEIRDIFSEIVGDLFDRRDTQADRSEQDVQRSIRLQISAWKSGEASDGDVRTMLQGAVTGARGMTDYQAAVMEWVRAHFGEAGASSTPTTSTEIERTLLTVWALVDQVSYVDLIEVVRGLLPDGEHPPRSLPADLREQWERGIHDDRRLRRDTRPAPDWQTAFAARLPDLMRSVGLRCIEDLTVVHSRDFQKNDVLRHLAERQEFIATIAARLKRRVLLFQLPRSSGLLAVRLLAAIRSRLKILVSPADFVRIATGLKRGNAMISVPRWIVSEHRNMGVRIFNDILTSDTIYQIGQTSALLNFAQLDEQQKAELETQAPLFDDEMLQLTANFFRECLAIVADHEVGPDFVDDCLDEIMSLVGTAEHALMFMAYMVLAGPFPSDLRLGQATLKLFEENWGADFLTRFDNHIFRTMNTAQSRPTRSVDRWADAVAVAAARPGSKVGQQALSSHLDDAIARHDIPWGGANRRRLDEVTALPLFAAQFLGSSEPDTSREGTSLLERLFARDAETHLKHIITISRLGDKTFYLNIRQRLTDLLAETYWVISDEIDPEEARLFGEDLNERLSHEIWGGITAIYGVAPQNHSFAVAQLIEAQSAKPLHSPDRLPVSLLDLFGPTIFLHWRFRMFGSRSLTQSEEAIYRMRLNQIKAAAADRLDAVLRAFQALAEAEDRLIHLFEMINCPKTAIRHRGRRDRVMKLVDFFSRTAVGRPN